MSEVPQPPLLPHLPPKEKRGGYKSRDRTFLIVVIVSVVTLGVGILLAYILYAMFFFFLLGAHG